ncbi:MAG: putative diguanylate cyclase [Methanomassiliicoccales archaeon PtaU1.Bin124]|nr:MAG: putative diguanylate cyclase [Methanomassiliicoccales archaeon PtaU1.Bin124]
MKDMGIKVLYVDDEPALLEICKAFLEEQGDITVDTTDSGPSALRMMADTTYDAIVSDFHMPPMDGIALLKTIRERNDDTPFILFTGKGREEVVIEALNNGADGYLQKGGAPSVQFAELRHKIVRSVAQNRAEKTLRQNEERFRSYIEGAHVAMVICQRGAVVFANRRSLTMFRYSSEQEVLGKHVGEFIAPQDRSRAVIGQQMLAASDNFDFDTDVVGMRADGTEIPLHIILSKVWTPWESAPATLLMFIDISRLRDAERSLRETQRAYKAIFQDAPIGIITIDAKGAPLDFNDEFPKMLGYSREELRGRTFEELTPDGDILRSNELLRSLIEGKIDSYGLEKRFISKAGTCVWVKMSVVKMRSPTSDGQAIVFISDITDRRAKDLSSMAMHMSSPELRTVALDQEQMIWGNDIVSRARDDREAP